MVNELVHELNANGPPTVSVIGEECTGHRPSSSIDSHPMSLIGDPLPSKRYKKKPNCSPSTRYFDASASSYDPHDVSVMSTPDSNEKSEDMDFVINFAPTTPE